MSVMAFEMDLEDETPASQTLQEVRILDAPLMEWFRLYYDAGTQMFSVHLLARAAYLS